MKEKCCSSCSCGPHCIEVKCECKCGCDPCCFTDSECCK